MNNNSSEYITYFGSYKIPLEIERVIPLLTILQPKTVHQVVKLVVFYLTGENLKNYDPELSEKAINSKQEEMTKNINKQIETEIEDGIKNVKLKQDIQKIQYVFKTGSFSVLFTAMYMIFREAIRLKCDTKKFKEQLVNLKMEKEIIKLLEEVYGTK
jgi:hypothetical protein